MNFIAFLFVWQQHTLHYNMNISNDNPRHRKADRIASIVGDSFAVHKDERALMAAMIDELSKGTR